ncbi:MAG: hypothetical protein M1831_001165 [Alyxoria varia]|nr:MAG: hypothetical protein M1831_001165 [Alyxoria varia]
MEGDWFKVRPLEPFNKTHFISLSTFDQTNIRAHVREHFFLPIKHDISPRHFCLHLTNALSRALSEHTHFAGEIVDDDPKRQTVQIQLDPTSAVDFCFLDLEAPAVVDKWEPISFEHLQKLKFPISRLPRKALDQVLPGTAGTGRIPSIRLQSSFLEGGMILSTAHHHSVSDGTGVREFLCSWARHTKALSCGSPLPIDPLPSEAVNRKRLSHGSVVGTPEELQSIFGVGMPGTKLNCVVQRPGPRERSSILGTLWRVSPLQLKSLKLAASSSDPNAPWISTKDALSALLWCRVMRARQAQGDETSKSSIKFAYNFRSRLSPPLHPSYVGNAAAVLAASSSIGDLTNTDGSWLRYAAVQMREAARRFRADALDSFIGYAESLPKITDIKAYPCGEPGTELWISDQTAKASFDLDWGDELGPIQGVRRPGSHFDGLCALLSQSPMDGLDFVMQLDTETTNYLSSDSELTKYAELIDTHSTV